MRIPTLQLLHGELDPMSSGIDQFRPVGSGGPNKDPDQYIFGQPATMYSGLYGLVSDLNAFDLSAQSWSLQIYGEPDGWAHVMSTRDFPVAAGEWQLKIHGAYLDLSYTVAPNNIVPVISTLLPENLRWGRRYYRVVYDGTDTKFYIDDTLLATIKINYAAPSGVVCFLGTQYGKKDTVVQGSQGNFELVRFDYGYAIQPSDFYKFQDEIGRDVALSFHNSDAVDSKYFDVLRLDHIKNYSPPLTADDIETAPDSKKALPIMTAATSGGYTVTQSSTFSGSFEGWLAVRDKTEPTAECWATHNALATDAAPHWIAIKSPTPIVFNGFRMSKRNTLVSYPTKFKLQGRIASTDEWETIFTEDTGLYPERLYHNVSFGVKYSYTEVRLLITENSNSLESTGSLFTAISDFQLFLVTGKAGNKIFGYSDGGMDIKTNPVAEGDPIFVVNHTHQALTGITADGYELTNRTSGTAADIQSPKSWTIEGRDGDSGPWTVLDTQVDQTDNTSGAVRSYPLGEMHTFTNWRMLISDTNGAGAETSVAELVLTMEGTKHYRDVTALGDGGVIASSTNPFPPSVVQQVSPMTALSNYPQTLTRSTAYSGAHDAYNAFGATVHPYGWVTGIKPTVSVPGWVVIEYADGPRTISGWDIANRGYADASSCMAPIDFVLEKWDAGLGDWVVIHSVTGRAEILPAEVTDYPDIGSHTSTKFRVSITDVAPGVGNFSTVGRIRLYDTAPQLTDIIATDQPANQVVDASGMIDGNYDPTRAFNGVTVEERAWISQPGVTAGAPAWISMEFTDGPREVVAYSLFNRDHATDIQAPVDFNLYGRGHVTDDWILLDAVVGNTDLGRSAEISRTLPSPARYSMFKLEVTQSTEDTVAIAEWELRAVVGSGVSVDAWKAFSGDANTHWTTPVKAMSGSEQALQLTTQNKDLLISLNLSDGSNVLTRGQVPDSDEYSYPEGAGYLIDPAVGPKKFVPITFSGFTITQKDKKKEVTFIASDVVAMSSENSLAASTLKGSGESLGPVPIAGDWQTIAATGLLNGQPFTMGPGGDDLPFGVYYGEIQLDLGRTNAFCGGIYADDDELLCQLTGGFADTSHGGTGGSITQVFFEKLTAGPIRIDVFTQGTGTPASVGTLPLGVKVKVLNMKLFKVA